VATGKWILFEEAVEIVRRDRKCTIGKAQALVRAAGSSGEVRSNVNHDALSDFIIGTAFESRLISKAGLLYWLDQQQPPRQSARPNNARKIDRARRALAALYPNGAPNQGMLSTVTLCQQVSNWLARDCQTRGVPSENISDYTISVAAGRRRRHRSP